MKKIAFAILIVLVLAALTSGCTSGSEKTAPAAPAVTTPAAAPATPDIRGTWAGTMQEYKEGKGYLDMSNDTMRMVIADQQGRLFSGTYTFVISGREIVVPFAGVIGIDGKSLTVVENANGYTTGILTGEGTMELTHADDSDPYSVALDTLKRV